MSFITIGSASHTGRRKDENQDHLGFYLPEDGSIPEKGILIALADGMGGRPGGSVASRIAIDTLIEEYYKDKSNNIIESLKNTFLKINKIVIEKGDKDRSIQGMGTTLVAVVLKKDKMYYSYVGDSRGYAIYNNEIMQFTEDHSMVTSLVKAGYITEEQAPTYPGGNIITKAIGIEPELKIDNFQNKKKIKTGQYILLCCDGLYNEISDDDILKTVRKHEEPDLICQKLVEQANEHGGEDNISVLIARVEKVGLISSLTGRFMR